jgi:acyl carrier protein
MCSRDYVVEFLTRLLREVGKIAPDRIREDSTLEGDLQMQSVAFIEIQVALEEEFDIEVDLLEVVEINQLGGIFDYIYRLAAESLDQTRHC